MTCVERQDVTAMMYRNNTVSILRKSNLSKAVFALSLFLPLSSLSTVILVGKVASLWHSIENSQDGPHRVKSTNKSAIKSSKFPVCPRENAMAAESVLGETVT